MEPYGLKDIFKETKTIRQLARDVMPEQVKRIYTTPVMSDTDELVKYEMSFLVRVGDGLTDLLTIKVDFPVECWDDYAFLEERLRQLRDRWFGGDI